MPTPRLDFERSKLKEGMESIQKINKRNLKQWIIFWIASAFIGVLIHQIFSLSSSTTLIIISVITTGYIYKIETEKQLNIANMRIAFLVDSIESANVQIDVLQRDLEVTKEETYRTLCRLEGRDPSDWTQRKMR